MDDKTLKTYLYQPNSEPKKVYYARLAKLSTDDLERAIKMNVLSRADRTYVAGLIYGHKRAATESTDDPHPDGWYDR